MLMSLLMHLFYDACLVSLDNQILLSPSRVLPFVFPRFPVSLTVFSRGSRFPPLSKNIDRLLSVDLFLAESI